MRDGKRKLEVRLLQLRHLDPDAGASQVLESRVVEWRQANGNNVVGSSAFFTARFLRIFRSNHFEYDFSRLCETVSSIDLPFGHHVGIIFGKESEEVETKA